MDRREFLKVVTAITAAAVVPGIATAAVEKIVDPMAKYREAMRLFDRCVAYASDREECSKRFGELLDYLHANFPEPGYDDETRRAAAMIVRGKYTIAQLRSIPPVVADEVYPIALAKLGLTAYNMEARPTFIGEPFNEFHRRYCNLIVRAHEIKLT